MNLVDEIKNKFASLHNNAAMRINSTGDHAAWVIRYDRFYGVGIPFDSETTVAERFANVKLKKISKIMDGKDTELLVLISSLEESRNEFASICAQFVDPGEDGKARNLITDNPSLWWKKWKALLGNSVKDKKPYSLIAEMLAYEKLIDAGENVSWKGPESGSNDIESQGNNYEVKSTLSKYDNLVTISSQFQLNKTSNNLFLLIYKMEESDTGESINSVSERLKLKLENSDQIEEKLEMLGFEEGMTSRNIKYSVLESRKYIVDENFPKITNESFISGKMPESIVKLSYTIDLNGLKFEKW